MPQDIGRRKTPLWLWLVAPIAGLIAIIGVIVGTTSGNDTASSARPVLIGGGSQGVASPTPAGWDAGVESGR